MSDWQLDDALPARAPALTLATDAARDTLTRVALGADVVARLLAHRSGEAAAQSLLNQDYALVMSESGGRSLAFCVCDGVGSSFSGDFAASFLAMRLTRWLAAQPLADESKADESQVSAALTTKLGLWAEAAQAQLQQRAIPSVGGVLVRETLTELRDTYGSETVFFAGRVDVDADNAAEALLCWMGNVAGWLCAADGSITALNTADDDASRWSTARGLRGYVRMARLRWTLPQRLIIHTDGANRLSALLATLDDDALREQALMLREAPGSDDLTTLDISWRAANA